MRADLLFLVCWFGGPADQEWLDDLNRERKKEQSDPISYELFEIVMDRFEKEWFDLVSELRSSFLRLFFGFVWRTSWRKGSRIGLLPG